MEAADISADQFDLTTLSLSWGGAGPVRVGVALHLSSAALSSHAHNCMAVTPIPCAQLSTFLWLLWGETGQGDKRSSGDQAG